MFSHGPLSDGCDDIASCLTKGLNKQNFDHKSVIIFLPIRSNIRLGAQKNRLIEKFLLSTHNICFGWEIRKLIVSYAPLSNMSEGM